MKASILGIKAKKVDQAGIFIQGRQRNKQFFLQSVSVGGRQLFEILAEQELSQNDCPETTVGLVMDKRERLFWRFVKKRLHIFQVAVVVDEMQALLLQLDSDGRHRLVGTVFIFEFEALEGLAIQAGQGRDDGHAVRLKARQPVGKGEGQVFYLIDADAQVSFQQAAVVVIADRNDHTGEAPLRTLAKLMQVGQPGKTLFLKEWLEPFGNPTFT